MRLMRIKLGFHKYKINIKLTKVSDNKEIVSEKVKNKNKCVRNYIVVTTFQWECWDDKGGQNLQYWFYNRNLFFILIKKKRFGKIKT